LFPDSALSLLRGAYLGTLIGGFLFFLAWEAHAPRSPLPVGSTRRRHLLRNFAMLGAVVIVADLAFGIALMDTTGRLAAAHTGLLSRFAPGLLVQLVVGFVAVDFMFYWWHRASHAVPLLWRIHRVHHSDPHLDATTATRFHPVEVSFTIVLVVVTLSTLGIPLWVDLARTLVINPLFMAQHANVAFPPRWEHIGRALIVTPELHRVHHSPLREEHDTNYGQVFSIWDRWFGTLREPPATVPEVGVRGLEGERWQTVIGMLLTPFRINGARPEL
jgi:sterol desaturase/sphingolipid hydroxylase (fatty acid hydroxylase superfamily)